MHISDGADKRECLGCLNYLLWLVFSALRRESGWNLWKKKTLNEQKNDKWSIHIWILMLSMMYKVGDRQSVITKGLMWKDLRKQKLYDFVIWIWLEKCPSQGWGQNAWMIKSCAHFVYQKCWLSCRKPMIVASSFVFPWTVITFKPNCYCLPLWILYCFLNTHH